MNQPSSSIWGNSMDDPPKSTSSEIAAEIHRVCALLGTIAEQYPYDSAESRALHDAALAFQQLQWHKGLLQTYLKIKAALNGEKEEEIRKKMIEYGIDPDELGEEI